MKPHNNFAQHVQTIRTPAVVTLALALACAFCLLTASTGTAVSNQCQVCHKRTSTLTLACNSLDYQRHLDHGDPPQACGATPSAIERPTIDGGPTTAPPTSN